MVEVGGQGLAFETLELSPGSIREQPTQCQGVAAVSCLERECGRAVSAEASISKFFHSGNLYRLKAD
jgi:hypothetical protein